MLTTVEFTSNDCSSDIIQRTLAFFSDSCSSPNLTQLHFHFSSRQVAVLALQTCVDMFASCSVGLHFEDLLYYNGSDILLFENQQAIII